MLVSLLYELSNYIEEKIEYLRADERERRIIKLVPYTCRHCELLGICRDEFNEWKCRNGCYFIDSKKEKRK